MALLLVGFFCKVPLYVVVGLHMAYLLQEENGERNTFFEFSGLKMVLVRSSVVSAVFSLPFSPFTVLGQWFSGVPKTSISIA